MKHVMVNPGVCGFDADIRAESDGMGTTLSVETQCPEIKQLVEDAGESLDTYDVLGLMGEPPLFERMRSNYTIHAACPTLAGIAKCIEAEAGMALPRDVSIRFIEDE